MPRVTNLPPVYTIADAATRTYLEALTNAWNVRNGHIDPDDDERFVTRGELGLTTRQELTKALQGSLGGVGGGGGGGSVGAKDPVLADLQAALGAWLDAAIPRLDVPRDLVAQIAALAARLGVSETGIFQINNISETSTSRSAQTLYAMQAVLGPDGAYFYQERETRVNKEMALASAINTMWAQLGSNQALIQDGQLAQATPSDAVAGKWSQVQAAVIDPQGNDKVARLREDYTVSANATNGRLDGLYSIKIDLSSGTPRVGGFGLAAVLMPQDPNAPPPIPTYAFDVVADAFTVSIPGTDHTVVPFEVTANEISLNTHTLIKDATISFAKIKNDITSDNWSPGVSGWAINKNGGAEFNSVVVRGDVTANRVIARSIISESLHEGAASTIGSNGGDGEAKAEVRNDAGMSHFIAFAFSDGIGGDDLPVPVSISAEGYSGSGRGMAICGGTCNTTYIEATGTAGSGSGSGYTANVFLMGFR